MDNFNWRIFYYKSDTEGTAMKCMWCGIEYYYGNNYCPQSDPGGEFCSKGCYDRYTRSEK